MWYNDHLIPQWYSTMITTSLSDRVPWSPHPSVTGYHDHLIPQRHGTMIIASLSDRVPWSPHPSATWYHASISLSGRVPGSIINHLSRTAVGTYCNVFLRQWSLICNPFPGFLSVTQLSRILGRETFLWCEECVQTTKFWSLTQYHVTLVSMYMYKLVLVLYSVTS